MIDKRIKNSLESLLNWISENGYRSYDPYDIKANHFVTKLTDLGNRNGFAEIIREGLFELFLIFPKTSRRIFKVETSINAKGMALLSTSYLNLFSLTNDIRFRESSEKCLIWLENNSININSGIGWGYPFDWQAKKFIPAYTPNGIVTTAVGEAFWQWYLLTNESRYLNQCEQICNFLITLPIDKINENQICFSYTPLFVNHVHNLNLFVAEYLIKIGLELKNKIWVELGNKAVNYTIANQLPDGSFDYDGPPENTRHFRDNYHTGFVLRTLYSIWKLTDNHAVWESLQKCYNHYLNYFFFNKKIPKFKPENIYRIDIHSCSESILSLSKLSKHFPQGIEIASNVLNWTINNLQNKNGYFYHGIFKSRLKFKFKSRVPYLRWSQAWMLLAMSEYITALNKNNNQ